MGSAPLKQYGITYSLDFARNRVRIQKLGSFRILGLHQIPPDAEIANAVLVGRPSGYYLHVTCYLPEKDFYRKSIGGEVGVDFGVGSKLTLSTGIKIDFELHETPRLKKFQRKLAKSEKGSKNRRKIRRLLRRKYEKLSNRRKDAQNKILAFLKLYEKVVFQEDFVKGWAKRFGRQVYSSGIGGLKARLRNSLEAPIPVDRFEPTSQECFDCGMRRKLTLADRVIKCECGWTCDKDLNAALVILRKGPNLHPDQAVGLVDRPELKPTEKEAAARILGTSPYIRVSFFNERGSPPF